MMHWSGQKENELVQKEAVIREVHEAAEQRLAIIEKWEMMRKGPAEV